MALNMLMDVFPAETAKTSAFVDASPLGLIGFIPAFSAVWKDSFRLPFPEAK